jgi:ATP-dependent DNA helicase RecG
MSVPVTFLKGVKSIRAAQLAKLGVYTVEDLYELYPRSYEDRSVVRKISELAGGESVTVCGYVKSTDTRKVNRTISVTNVRIYDETGNMKISVFNGKYGERPFKVGALYAFYGKVNRDQYGLSMTNPVMTEYSDGWDKSFFTIQPIYPLTKGLTQNILRKMTAEALKIAPPSYETLPKAILGKYGMPQRDVALKNLHFPENSNAAAESIRRFKFEELFTLQLMLLMLKDAQDKAQEGISFKNAVADKEIIRFISTLPFELTEGQKNVWGEIARDMERDTPMNRLVIGDVGSGKTVLAVLSMLKAILSGYQAVFMAPTEILAEQHYATVSKMFELFNIKVWLVTGSLTAKEKKEALAAIESGDAMCIIGTHALIQPTVKYKKLGLAVTDEQHRFGVRQRAMLSSQGGTPDVLVMTATPIPRTLALILYGDMDISTLKTLPRGRLPIKTYALDYSMYDRICKWILRIVAEGQQVYMVYPLIEEGEDTNLRSVTERFASLSNGVFKGISCGLLHGKMTPQQKESVMRDFKEGKVQILFSTTVVEVGVDVPNAVLMVVENAERFGLAQLHQLRGRVGRGSKQSYCVLFSQKVTQRMKIMEEMSDGFELSEQDLLLRGPGDFFGVEQHGLPPLKIANLYQDTDVLQIASEAAKGVLANKDRFADFLRYVREKYPERIQL